MNPTAGRQPFRPARLPAAMARRRFALVTSLAFVALAALAPLVSSAPTLEPLLASSGAGSPWLSLSYALAGGETSTRVEASGVTWPVSIAAIFFNETGARIFGIYLASVAPDYDREGASAGARLGDLDLSLDTRPVDHDGGLVGSVIITLGSKGTGSVRAMIYVASARPAILHTWSFSATPDVTVLGSASGASTWLRSSADLRDARVTLDESGYGASAEAGTTSVDVSDRMFASVMVVDGKMMCVITNGRPACFLIMGGGRAPFIQAPSDLAPRTCGFCTIENGESGRWMLGSAGGDWHAWPPEVEACAPSTGRCFYSTAVDSVLVAGGADAHLV